MHFAQRIQWGLSSVKFLAYSVTFKIIIIAIVLVSIYEIGLINEGRGKSYIVFPWMGFIHLFSMIPRFGNGSLTQVLTYSLTNAFYFLGSIFSLFLIRKYIRCAEFRIHVKKSGLVMTLVAVFCISTVWHYLAMFVNQEQYFSDMGYFFATERGEFAFNAYDNIISIAILLQIAQASINTGLKRLSKRQLSTRVSPTIGSTSD